MIYLLYTFLAVIIGGFSFAIYAMKFTFALKVENDYWFNHNLVQTIINAPRLQTLSNSIKYIPQEHFNRHLSHNPMESGLILQGDKHKESIARGMAVKMGRELLEKGLIQITDESIYPDYPEHYARIMHFRLRVYEPFE